MWVSNNPFNPLDIYKTRRLMNYLRRRGELQRQPCQVCGSPKSEGHHDDYTQPLAIIWLCRIHHCARHRMLGWR